MDDAMECLTCGNQVAGLSGDELARANPGAYPARPLAHFNPGGNFVYAGDHKPEPIEGGITARGG